MERRQKIALFTTLALVGGVLAYIGYKATRPSRKGRKSAQIAIGEWGAWGKGSVKEGDSRTMGRLRKYWREGAGVNNWSDSKMVSEPWSAAFISYVMKKGGAGDDFKYNASHSVYIRDAINNRKQNLNKRIKGYRPSEVKVEVGDLICAGRSNSRPTYDTTGRYSSHCDIVVEVDERNVARMIGGNVSNSVSSKTLALDNQGRVDESKYFVVIKNKK